MNMSDFSNIHEGKTAIVLGSGPSLRDFDYSIWNDNFVSFGINSSIAKVPDCDYFVSDDNGILFWTYYKDYIVPSKCTKFLYSKKLEKYAKLIPVDDKIFYDHYEWNPKHKSNIQLTDDPNIPIIAARTSLASAMHIAYIMGIRNFLLFGVDCRVEDNKRYFWEFEDQPFVEPTIKEITSDKYLGSSDIHFAEFYQYWEAFEEYNKDKITVHDCSNGLLDMFDKMSIDDAIKKFG